MMKQKKSIAIFMITLILSLPIYSAMVFGDFRITSISGTDNAQGFRKVDDTTSIKILSDVQDVRLGNSQLNTCTGNSPNYTCTFTDSDRIDEPSFTYLFYRYIGGQMQQPAASGLIRIDNTRPTFSIFNVSYVNSNVTSKATVSDFGYNSAISAGSCSGIKEIKFYDVSSSGTYIGTYNGTLPNRTCTSSSLLTFIYPRPTTDGFHDYYAEAYDYLGNMVSSDVNTLFVDITPPNVENPRLVVGAGITLTYISTNTIFNVRVNATIRDYNISLTNSVTADLSRLNSNRAALYRNVNFTCSLQSESTYSCVSSPIELFLPSGNANLTFNTIDLNGNTRSQNISISLTRDTTLPAVSIYTSNCDSEQCYLHQGENSIYVSLIKQGAGFASRSIFLTAPSLGFSTSQVNLCILNGTGWLCSKNITVPNNLAEGSSQVISINPLYSKDDIGNPVPYNYTNLIYDSIKPTLVDNIIFQKQGGVGYLQTRDSLEIKLWVTDNVSGVKSAYANLNNAIPNAGWVSTDCNLDASKGENVYLCNWRPQTQLRNNYYNASVAFNVTDYAGNTNSSIRGSFTIYGRTNQSQDFWNIDSQLTRPEFLDIISSKYLPGKLSVWTDVKLTSTTNDARIINSALKGGVCNPANGTTNYLERAKIFPPAATDQNPHVQIVLEMSKSQNLPDYTDSLNFECILQLTTASGNNVYPVQELPVIIKVGLKNFGVDLPKEYTDKINAFRDKLEKDKWIDSLNKFLDIGRKICVIGTNLMKIWFGGSDILNKLGEVLKGNPLSYGAGVGVSSTESGINAVKDKSYFDYIMYVCGIMDCSLVPKLIGGDWNKAINIYISTLAVSSKALTPLRSGSSQTILDQSNFPPQIESNAWEASKKSIIVSGILLCVPGIVYNINKARQIDCMYLDCAEKWTAAGYNPYTCEVMRANAYCNFVYGSIFHAIPFSGLVDYFGSLIKLFASNPVTAGYMATSIYCATLDPAVANTKSVCRWTYTFTVINNLIGNVVSMFTMFTDTPKDYCKEVLRKN